MDQRTRPRHWAAAIAQLPSVEQRREALTLVKPDHWVPLVKTHLRLIWLTKRHRIKLKQASHHATD